MKKVLSIVCLLAIVASCLFVFASCGGGATPNADMEAAKAALEAAGYTVTISNKTLNAFKTGSSDNVQITYCTNESEAQAKYDQLKASYDAQKALADEMDADFTGEYGISGTVVWGGTPDAIEASAGK